MAVEPLGSVMTYQAQAVQPTTQAKVSVERPAAEYTEGTAQGNAPYVDRSTVVVTQTAEKGGQSGAQQQQTNEHIRKAVEQMNKKMEHSEAIFGIHEATNRVTIKLVDKTTKEVIKELPPEKTLDMIAKVWELAGMMVDEKR